MGISWSEFWTLNPRKLSYIREGYAEKFKADDYMAWWFGRYTFDAVSIALSNAFRKKGAEPIKYLEKSYLMEIEDHNAEQNLTEDEIREQRKLFLAKLQAMQYSFEQEQNSKE